MDKIASDSFPFDDSPLESGCFLQVRTNYACLYSGSLTDIAPSRCPNAWATTLREWVPLHEDSQTVETAVLVRYSSLYYIPLSAVTLRLQRNRTLTGSCSGP